MGVMLGVSIAALEPLATLFVVLIAMFDIVHNSGAYGNARGNA